jgi:DNA invertase Pin-like site-specific DNA recombinase
MKGKMMEKTNVERSRDLCVKYIKSLLNKEKPYEIAARLGITTSTVYNIIKRGEEWKPAFDVLVNIEREMLEGESK